MSQDALLQSFSGLSLYFIAGGHFAPRAHGTGYCLAEAERSFHMSAGAQAIG